MKARLFWTMVICCALLSAATVMLTQAQQPGAGSQYMALEALGSAFTYQGRLLLGDSPVDGTCDLQFSLWDAATGGTQTGTVQTKSGVNVNNGLFTVLLDFAGQAITGTGKG